MDLSLSQITYHSRRRDIQQQQPVLNSGMLYYGNDDGNSNNLRSNINNLRSNINLEDNNNSKANNTYDEQEFSYGPIVTRVNYNKNINNNSQQSTITKQLYLENLSNYSYENNNKDNKNKENNYESTMINMPSFSNLTNCNQLEFQQQQQLHSFRDAYNSNGNNRNKSNSNINKDKLNQQNYHQQYQQTLRQKLKTLTEHLKSALQANSEIEQKCNQLKSKLQQKQTKHMNQLSVLKAQLIIRMNQLNEKDLVIGQQNNKLKQLQNNKLKQLQNKLSQLQQQSEIYKQKYQIQTKRNQSNKKQIQQLKSVLIDYEMNKDTNINQLTYKLTQKDQQIIQLKKQLEENKQMSQQQLNQKSSYILDVQQQLIINRKTLQQTLSLNIKLNQQTQRQSDRINQLNQSIKEICQNSQHLFEEINQVKMENIQMKNRLQQKQQQYMEMQQKQQQYMEMQQKLLTIQNHLQQLSITNEQSITKYNTLQQKHTKLQQENIQINTNNTSLLQEIQILNQQIRELKQLCIAQEMKQVQLLRRVEEGEGEIGVERKRDRERDRDINRDRERDREIMPTRDIQRRLHTQGEVQTFKINNMATSFDTVRTTTRNNSISRCLQHHQQPRFNYLNNQKDLQQQAQQSKRQNIVATTFNQQPYSHLLSFQLPKQKVHTRLNTSEDVINNYNPIKRRLSTCMDDRESSVCYDMPLMKDYDLSCYRSTFLTKNSGKHDRRSKSFYVERNSNNNNNDLLISQKQRDLVYRSVIDPKNTLMREKQTNRNNGIRSMRHSLDLREKSLDFSRKSSQQQNTTRQQQLSMSLLSNNNNNKSTNTQFQKIYTQNNIPQDSTQAKNMFFSKLDKMKLSAKQTVSQGNTQRQALKQINPLLHQQQLRVQNDNYFVKTNRDTTSVQTIIKQKSNLINQRKNLLTFNLNNQMIQKNILKLQKTTNGTQSNKGILRTKQDVFMTHKENSNLQGLSPIYQELSNKKSQPEQKLTTAIYQNCKKMLYNHPNK